MSKKKVIIIGGGFGGIKTALGLRKADIELLVIDKTNHHLFQPLLYQVATAALSASDIAIPIREILHRQDNVSVIMDEVIAIDKQNKTIQLLAGEVVSFDFLVVAAGAVNDYYGRNEWKPYAHGLKTLTDAVKVREHILWSFELAEKCATTEEANKHLCFVVIGGGPTGVEMVGAIAETAQTSMLENFRKINPMKSKIYLIEGSDRILLSYPPKLSVKAKKDLEKMGIEVITDAKVTNITADGVYIGEKFIESANVIWAAGNIASPLLKTLEVPLDRQGRVLVESDLTIPGHPDVFVIGDAAAIQDPEMGILPAVAPVAMQGGSYAAKIIEKSTPKDKREPFKYFDKGSMATIGKDKAVATIGKFTFSGFFAWLVWCFIHIAFLISFRNRYIVMSQWIFLYLTNKRNVCIIHSVEEIKKESL